MAFDQKTCAKCGETKPLEEFHRKAKSKDGRQARCRPCNTLVAREQRAARPEHYREYSSRRYAENREEAALQAKRWREQNPQRHAENYRRWYEKNRAHRAAYGAERNRELMAVRSARVRRIRKLLDHFEGRDAYLDYIAHAVDSRSDARSLEWLCGRIDGLVAARVYGEF